MWSVPVPDYLQTYPCIQVLVESWPLGAGVHIEAATYKIQSTEGSPESNTDAEVLLMNDEGIHVIE